MAVSIELLKRFGLLRGLSQGSLSQLSEQSALRKIPRRGIIINGGQQEDSLCFLFEGRLQGVDFTLDGREVGLYFVEPGDFCGELGLFDAQGQPESVIALTKSQVMFIPAALIRQVLKENPNLTEPLFNRLAERLRQQSAQRALLGLPSTTGRVCGQLWMILQQQLPDHVLSDLSNTPQTSNQAPSCGTNPTTNPSPTIDKASIFIANPPTHQELAIMLNLSRESVTRVFQTLQSKAIVQRDGNSRLLILDLSQLKQLAESGE